MYIQMNQTPSVYRGNSLISPCNIGTSGVKFGAATTSDPVLAKQYAREAAALYQKPENKAHWKHLFDDAKRNILDKRREANGKPGFVVLDVDDTFLDYSPLYAEIALSVNPKGEFVLKHGMDGGLRKVFAEGNPGTYSETADFIRWLNENDIPYCFLSARVEPYRDKMQALLEQAGVIGDKAPQCFGLYLRPEQSEPPMNASEFKTHIREQLEQEHGELWATVGDQPGDMVANPKDLRVNVLLPNYFPIARRSSSTLN